MFLLYPLYLGEGKICLYIILTIISFCGFLLSNKELCKRKKTDILKNVSILIIIFLLLNSIISLDIMQGGFYICLILNFFFIRYNCIDLVYHIKMLLISGSVLLLCILIYLFTQVPIIPDVEFFLLDSSSFLPWMILITVINSIVVCTARRKSAIHISAIISFLGFWIIVYYGDIVAIWIVFVSLLMIPQVYMPTVKIIKRNLILVSVLVFMISNISLMMSGKIPEPYGSWICVFMDIFLMVLGVLIMNYWKKIPKGFNEEEILMVRFRQFYKVFTIFIIALFINLLFLVNIVTFSSIETSGWLLLAFRSIQNSFSRNGNVIYVLFEQYGIIGCAIGLIFLVILWCKSIKIRNHDNTCIEKMSLFVSRLFLIQTLFFEVNCVSMPIYVIFLALSLSTNESKKAQKILSTSEEC